MDTLVSLLKTFALVKMCAKKRRRQRAVWRIFRHERQSPQKVTTGRFEIERNGEVAFLEYELSENLLVLSHTEVPKELRGKGLASELAETALQWARQHNLKVDIVCPVAREYITKHPEYSDLLLR